MKHQNNYTEHEIRSDTEQGFTPDIDYSRLLPMEQHDGRQSRSLRTLSAEADYLNNLEKNRAVLAFNAMNNVAALSAVGAALAESVPCAEERLNAIVEAYTAGSIYRIVRWSK